MFKRKKKKPEEEKQAKPKGEKKFAAAAAAAAADVILEAMVDGVGVADVNGNIIQVNKSMAEMCSYKSPEEMVGKTIFDLMAEREIPRITKRFMDSIKKKERVIKNIEIVFRRKDGKEFPVMVSSTNMWDEKGEFVGNIAVIRDITELKRAGEERLAAARSVEETMESMMDCVAVVDLEGKVTQVNKVVETMFGYKKDEVIGKIPVEFIVEEDIQRFMEGLREALETGFLRNFECTVVAKDGRKISTSVNITLLKDTEGNPKSMVAVLRDITELKAKTKELEKSAAYIDAMGEALMVLDMNRKVVKVNKSALKLWGYNTPEEMLKLPFETTFPKKEHEKHYAEMKRGIETGTVRPFETLVLTKDGREIPAMISGTAMKDAEGKPVGFVGIFRDITELKRAEEGRVAALKRAADTIEAMSDGIFIHDMDGKIISINSAWEKMTGSKKSEWVGKNTADSVSKIAKSEDIGRFKEHFMGSMHGKVQPPLIMNLISKDGREVPIAATVAFIRDIEGKPLHVVVTIKDITEIKKAQEEAQKAAAARETAKMMEVMVDGVGVADPNGNIIQANNALAKMLGFTSPKELIGESIVNYTAEKDIPNVMEWFKKSISAGITMNFEFSVKRRDGAEFPCMINASVLKDEKGEIVGLIATMRDITEIKKTREELQAKLKELEDFHDVAVGTELEMAKLEEEVERLKKELEKKG